MVWESSFVMEAQRVAVARLGVALAQVAGSRWLGVMGRAKDCCIDILKNMHYARPSPTFNVEGFLC